jgi:protein-disulfide isomerase
MTETHARAKWQSLVETMSLVVVAVAVGWMAVARSTPTIGGREVIPPPRTEPPVPLQPITLTGAQILGNRSAQAGLVVYSDFQCPFCGKFARETLPSLEEQYVRPGKLLIAFRQFPLPNHVFAVKAAEAADCAGRQGKFWPYHDRLFANPQALDPASLQEHARQVRLDPKQFAACLDGEASAVVQADKAGGAALQVAGTPAFLAGAMLSDGRLRVIERISGAQPVARFQDMLDRVLRTAEAGPARGQN